MADRVSPRAAAASSASKPASGERFALTGRPASRRSGTIMSTDALAIA